MEIIGRRDNRDYGPYSVAAVQKYLASGQLKPGDFARLKGDPSNSHRTLAHVISQSPRGSGKPAQQHASKRPVMSAPAKARNAAPAKAKNWPAALSSYGKKGLFWLLGLVLQLCHFLRHLRKPRVAAAVFAVFLLVCAAAYWRFSTPRLKEAPLPSPTELSVVPTVPIPSPPTPAEVKLLGDADAFALSMGPMRGTAVPEFVKRLEANPLSADPLWKARCIFRWITDNIAYDMAARHRDYDPDAILQKRVAVCAGYSALFTSLCQTAGVEVVAILGYFHNRREEIGKSITPDTDKHVWNAVRIGSRWLLIDVTAASGYYGNGQFFKEFQPDWFDCPPECMIRSHLPDDPRWQLLPQPVSQLVFQQFPIFSHRFYRFVLNAAYLIDGTLPGSSPFLQLSVPHNVKILAHLIAKNGDKTPLSIDSQPEPGGGSDRVSLSLPAVATSGCFVQVSINAPGDTTTSYAFAAYFRVGDVSRRQAVSPTPKPTNPLGTDVPDYYPEYNRRNAKLEVPLVKNLPANKRQNFKIVVPGARNIRFFQGADWSFLHRTTGKDTFEGNFLLGAGTCGLYAEFDDTSGKLIPLVGFEAH